MTLDDNEKSLLEYNLSKSAGAYVTSNFYSYPDFITEGHICKMYAELPRIYEAVELKDKKPLG